MNGINTVRAVQAKRETRRKAIEALESRISYLKRGGYTREERQFYSGSESRPTEEIELCRKRIETIRSLE